jgi:thiol-disulfide isomerase/thioredoxin
MNRAGIITIGVMAFIIVLALSYILLRDESVLQKHSQTPAAKALLIDAPENAFTDLGGNTVSVSEHFGDIIVVTSWASWCPQCLEGFPQLGQLAQEYQDRGVVILAINRAEDKYSAERYLATVTIPEGLKIVLDPSDHYFSQSGGYAMPETIIYNKDGQEDLHQRGNLNTEEIRQHLNTLLE